MCGILVGACGKCGTRRVDGTRFAAISQVSGRTRWVRMTVAVPGTPGHERLDITQVIVRDSGRVARSGRRRPGHLRLPRAPQCRRQHGDPHTCDDTTPEAIRPARGCIPAPVSAMMTAPYGTAATSRAGVRARRSDAGSTMPLDATDRLRAYRGGMVVCPSRRPNSGGGPRAAARLGGLALTVQRFRRQHTEGMTRDTHG